MVVKCGDVRGWIVDPFSREVRAYRAVEDGCLFVFKTGHTMVIGVTVPRHCGDDREETKKTQYLLDNLVESEAQSMDST